MPQLRIATTCLGPPNAVNGCRRCRTQERGSRRHHAAHVILAQCLSPQVLRYQADARVLMSLQSLVTLRYRFVWPRIFPMLVSPFDSYGVISPLALNLLLLTACDLPLPLSQ